MVQHSQKPEEWHMETSLSSLSQHLSVSCSSSHKRLLQCVAVWCSAYLTQTIVAVCCSVMQCVCGRKSRGGGAECMREGRNTGIEVWCVLQWVAARCIVFLHSRAPSRYFSLPPLPALLTRPLTLTSLRLTLSFLTCKLARLDGSAHPTGCASSKQILPTAAASFSI